MTRAAELQAAWDKRWSESAQGMGPEEQRMVAAIPDLLAVVRAAQEALDDIAVATVVLEQDGYAKESMFLHQHHARLAAALVAFEEGGKP